MRRGFGNRWRGWLQAHPSNVEIFFEAIRLEQVGKLERANVAAAFTDFTLQISDEPTQVLEGEAGTKPLIPLALPVKSQSQVLTCKLAVEAVGGGDLFLEWAHALVGSAELGPSNPGTQGT